MAVDKPLSKLRYLAGPPTLTLDFLSSAVKARHSEPRSKIFSLMTSPQLKQMVSPISMSVTISRQPHSGQGCWVIVCFDNSNQSTEKFRCLCYIWEGEDINMTYVIYYLSGPLDFKSSEIVEELTITQRGFSSTHPSSSSSTTEKHIAPLPQVLDHVLLV
jgi:hypothetical protein